MFRVGLFGWADLYRWRRAFDDAMPRTMTYSDIDEVANRVEIAMPDEAGRSEAYELARTIGIPADAFGSHLASRATPATHTTITLVDSLLGYARPTYAGMKVELRYSSTLNGVPVVVTNSCSLGANVSVVGSPDPVFLTNSHCTEKLFHVDPSTDNPTWYQPTYPVGGPVALADRTDPGLFQGGELPCREVLPLERCRSCEIYGSLGLGRRANCISPGLEC